MKKFNSILLISALALLVQSCGVSGNFNAKLPNKYGGAVIDFSVGGSK